MKNLISQKQLVKMFNMKRIFFLTFLMVAIIAMSGCTSQNNSDKNNDHSTGDNTSINNHNVNTIQNIGGNQEYDVSGRCYHVVDGDTIDVEGVGRVRLVGINTPERDEPGYQNATDYVKSMVLGKTVNLDIDDAKHYDKYNRTLAVVYINNINLNKDLLKRGYAKIMYIPPSEFNPYSWT